MYHVLAVKYKMTYRVLAHNNMLLPQFIHYMFRNSSFYVEDILLCMYIYYIYIKIYLYFVCVRIFICLYFSYVLQ